MSRRLRKLTKKGKKIARKVAKNKVVRELGRMEMEIAADMLAKTAKKLKERAKRMKR